MSQYKEVIFNVETGQASERLFTAEEIKQTEADLEKMAQLNKEVEKYAAAKETAQAKLKALGLTIDDLAALGL